MSKNECKDGRHGEYNKHLLTVEAICHEKEERLRVCICRECGYSALLVDGRTSGPYYDETKDDHTIVIHQGNKKGE